MSFTAPGKLHKVQLRSLPYRISMVGLAIGRVNLLLYRVNLLLPKINVHN